MPYALRSPSGTIESLHREWVAGGEDLPPDHPEVLAFLGGEAQARFQALDANLVRVLEDLVDVLISRNIICITDLPLEAQHKLFERKHFRERVGSNALKLFDTSVDDTGFVP